MQNSTRKSKTIPILEREGTPAPHSLVKALKVPDPSQTHPSLYGFPVTHRAKTEI